MTRRLWAAQWRSRNRLDGETRHLLTHRGTCLPALFTTRRAARDWIAEHYGYIRLRPDLQAEPHGWQMPRAVRVRISEEQTGQ